MLLNNVLRKIAIVILPSIPTQSLRLQVIWVLCQFIKSEDIQRKLLCDLIRELDRKKESDEDFEAKLAKLEHVCLYLLLRSCRPLWLRLVMCTDPLIPPRPVLSFLIFS